MTSQAPSPDQILARNLDTLVGLAGTLATNAQDPIMPQALETALVTARGFQDQPQRLVTFLETVVQNFAQVVAGTLATARDQAVGQFLLSTLETAQSLANDLATNNAQDQAIAQSLATNNAQDQAPVATAPVLDPAIESEVESEEEDLAQDLAIESEVESEEEELAQDLAIESEDESEEEELAQDLAIESEVESEEDEPQPQRRRVQRWNHFGNSGNPKMNAAVEAVWNGEKDLVKALKDAGFIFPNGTEGPRSSTFDSENISLNQRLKQLRRRIRKKQFLELQQQLYQQMLDEEQE